MLLLERNQTWRGRAFEVFQPQTRCLTGYRYAAVLRGLLLIGKHRSGVEALRPKVGPFVQMMLEAPLDFEALCLSTFFDAQQ